MVPALLKGCGGDQEPDDFRPESNDLSSAVTVCSSPPSSQFQMSCWPTLTWTSLGLKAMPLIVTGPSPDTGTVVWVTPTSPPVSLLHPVTPSSVAARTSVAEIARRRTTPESRGGAVIVAGAMVAGLAFVATAVATLFAEA